MENYDLDAQTCHTDMLRSLGEHSAAIVHELRGPLAALSANLQTMERLLVKQGNTQHEERFHTLYTEISMMRELMDQFLLLASSRGPRLQPLSLRRCLDQTLMLLNALLLRQGIKLRIEQQGMDLPVVADERHLKQILVNLIINAADALPEQGGKIEILLNGDEAGQHLLISDNGSGVPRELRGRIFEPFFSTKDKGGGLGLAISRQLARESGGELRLLERPGEGASFLLSLPNASQRQHAAEVG